MKTLACSFLVVALMGCGSSSNDSCGDGGCSDDRPRLWGLSRGVNQFSPSSIADVNDPCFAAPAAQVGMPFDVTYLEATRTVSVGGQSGTPAVAAYGTGTVAGNAATLTRENETGDGSGCLWHQKDTGAFTLFFHDKFSLAVTEERTMYGAGCTTPPGGGACSSSWTWIFERSQ
jgi:hypothetical protein